jgi:predicted PurR-regulated permease PerM
VVLKGNAKDGIRFKGKIYLFFCWFFCFCFLFVCLFVLLCFVFVLIFVVFFWGGGVNVLHTSQEIQYNYRQDTILHYTSTINNKKQKQKKQQQKTNIFYL